MKESNTHQTYNNIILQCLESSEILIRMQRGKKNMTITRRKSNNKNRLINDGDDKISSHNLKLPIVNMFKN